MSKVKQNIAFQTIYQVLIVLTPLITSPYVSRVLGAEGLGIYSYSNSIANYFMIVAMLGTNTYGSKIIATVSDNRQDRSRVFSEIIAMQIFLTIIGSFIYVFYVINVHQENLFVSWIQLLMIVSCMFNVNWFFFGLEEFKTTVTRNIVVKIVTIMLIFLVVHTQKDLWKYVLILAGGELISQGILFFLIFKHVDCVFPTIRGIISHLKPNLILFVPGIAFALNHDLDKTMIGIFSDYHNTGCYYNAEKLIKIPTGIINGIGVVLMPHMTNMVAKGNKVKTVAFLRNSLYPIMLFSFAICGGVASVAKEFVPIFFGSGYEECVLLIEIMAVAMIFKTVANIVRTQYLIPNNKDQEYSTIVLLGAIINCIMNYCLIKRFGAVGAAVATFVAEVLVCIGHIVLIERDIPFTKEIIKSFIFIIPSAAMYLLIRLLNIGRFVKHPFVVLIVEIIIGASVYLLTSIPCAFAANKSSIRQILGKVKNKK